ncbi:hypothetical protein BJP34_23810 [Moorena producens PAL-8-15-08-1]|uniref:Uncharacterized protein n=1 Tax=Moorena producens PAL-8-15-08-1 TaxID=1458985 RepID=A0A1D8TWN3_9CYAN|nr:hypothetical protein [Moorena producens]AOX02057.1 hypothetical protein BJP34_23810 [Moorena producens PAL-8-15-08-1]
MGIAPVNSGRVGGWFQAIPTLLNAYWLVGIALVNSGRIGSWFQAMPTLQNAYYKMRSRSGSKRERVAQRPRSIALEKSPEPEGRARKYGEGKTVLEFSVMTKGVKLGKFLALNRAAPVHTQAFGHLESLEGKCGRCAKLGQFGKFGKFGNSTNL